MLRVPRSYAENLRLAIPKNPRIFTLITNTHKSLCGYPPQQYPSKEEHMAGNTQNC